MKEKRNAFLPLSLLPNPQSPIPSLQANRAPVGWTGLPVRRLILGAIRSLDIPALLPMSSAVLPSCIMSAPRNAAER